MSFQICRICYKRGYDLLKLKEDSHNYEKKISSCIPEIDIYIINNPGICQKCADMLDIAYELRNLCLENEKLYNNTFIEKDKELINPNQISIDCNEDSTESAACEIDENSSSQNVLLDAVGIKTELMIFCSTCKEEFSSSHDKKLHDFKKHRRLQHIHLKSLLSPINRNSNDLLQMNQNIIQFDTVESVFNDKYSSVSNVDENQDSAEAIACNECDITFANKHELDSHKLIHVKKSCDTCMKMFDKENEFEDHVKLHSVKCCCEFFPTVSLLQLHMYKEHNKICGICDVKFIQFSELFSHLLEHLKGNWYKCDVCEKQFKTQEDLKEHNCNTSHLSQEVDDEHVKVHKVQVESTKDTKIKKIKKFKKFKCRICNKGYRSRSLLAKHRYSEHTFRNYYAKQPAVPGFQDNPYACDLCGSEYKLYIHLKMHNLQVHCDKILTIPIVDCRKDSFYRDQEGLRINFDVPADYLTVTKEISTFRRKVEARSRCICFICRILFRNVSTLYAHGGTEHLSCCNSDIMSVEMFLHHNPTHYNEADKTGDNGNILCSLCDVKHKNYVSLLAHHCNSQQSKSEIDIKRPNTSNVNMEGTPTSRCTIEAHETDSSDESESVMHESDSSSSHRTGCEICKKQFDCRSHLMDHIKTHI